MERRSQHQKDNGNNGLIIVIIMLLIVVIFLALIILNIVGKKKEAIMNQSSSPTISTTQLSNETVKTVESTNNNYKFAVDFDDLYTNKSDLFYITEYEGFPLTLRSFDGKNLTLMMSVKASPEGHTSHWSATLKEELIDETEINVKDGSQTKAVHVNTYLRNITDQESQGVMQDLFSSLYAETDPIFAYYKKSGNIALSFKSTEDNNYFYLAFHKAN